MPSIQKQSAKPKPAPSNTSNESAWDLVASVRMLVYGASGTGKTTLGATFPGPILWLICSGGNKPGELRSIDTPEYRKKITPRIIRSTDQMKGFIKEGENYATTIIDHASGLQDLTLKEILGLDELPAQKSWGMAKMQQYGESSMMCKEIFRAMLNLPGNVLIISQERSFEAPEGTEDLIMPTVSAALTPSVTGWLCPACDYVCQTFKKGKISIVETTINKQVIKTIQREKGVEYCLRTGPHDVYMTKFRIPKGRELPEYIVDPTFEKITALIAGERWIDNTFL